jgi:hypothetical protein
MTWRKMKWMVGTLFASEFILGKAFADLRSASYHQKQIEMLPDDDRLEWTIAHGFFANMGGFVINSRKSGP